MDGLLSRPALASACWRASMLESAFSRQWPNTKGRGTALGIVAHLLSEQLVRRETVGIFAAQLPLSQIDVADATAVPTVDVNRTIQTLRSLNVLSSATHAIEVVDRKQLFDIAGFDSHYLDMSDFISKWAMQIEKLLGLDRTKRTLI